MPKTKLKRLLVGVATGGFSLVAAGEAVTTSPRSVAAKEGLTEVIVTARRVEENAQTVPITIHAFNNEQLRQSAVSETRDLMYHVPGIVMTGSADLNNSVVILRGTGPTGAQGHGIPGTVTYFADVPLPVNATSQAQYDLASIQVLKGPQGTLFGRNTMGGAILIYPQAPNYDSINGYVQGTAGSYNWREAEGALNVPLVPEKLALRISGHRALRDGYVENVSPGMSDAQNMDNQGVRVQLRWDPAENIKNNFMFDYYKSDTGNGGVVLTYADKLEGVKKGTSWQLPGTCTLLGFCMGTGDLYKTDSGNFDPDSFVKQWGITDRLDVDFDSVSFTNILSYREDQYDAHSNGDGVAFNALNAIQRTNEKQYTEEAQLKGKLFNDKLDWLTGVFYSKNDALEGNVAKNDMSSLGQLLGFLGAPPFLIPPPAPAGYPFYTTESKAVFANLTVHLSNLLEGLDFNVGGRYTWDKYELCTGVAALGGPYDSAPFNLTPSQCESSTPGLVNASRSSDNTGAPTWTAGLNWAINDNVFTYLTTRRGYRSGGLNGPQFSGELASNYQSFKPEKVVDYEIGAKTQWVVRDMYGTFNVDAFRAKTEDVQLGALNITTAQFDVNQILGGNPFGSCAFGSPLGTDFDGDCNAANDPTNTILTFNGGSRTTTGFEFDATFSPIENLIFSANGTVYHNHFDVGAIPPLFAPYMAAAGITDPAQIGGAAAPLKSATLGANYRLPLEHIGILSFTADAYWADKIDGVNGAYTIPDYHITNFRFDWNSVMESTVDLSVFVRNAFDQKYVVATSSLSAPGNPSAPATGDALFDEAARRGYQAVIMGEPRVWGFQARYRFGVK